MDLSAVHDVHMTISAVHRFVYFVGEAADEFAALGVRGLRAYFASRAAPLGPVPDEVVVATFYNFSPRAVRPAMAGVWDAAAPAAVQAARFRGVARALDRVGARLSDGDVAEARTLCDAVLARLDLAGKPLAAANAAVTPPDDPDVALWQQLTVLREWRGDAHISLLVANEVGPCECMVLQVGTGRFPLDVTRASRQWDDQEWGAAIERLRGRGWVDGTGAMTPAGTAERERIEADTDRLCAPVWEPVGDRGLARLAELVAPIHAAMDAAGTYAGPALALAVDPS